MPGLRGPRFSRGRRSACPISTCQIWNVLIRNGLMLWGLPVAAGGAAPGPLTMTGTMAASARIRRLMRDRTGRGSIARADRHRRRPWIHGWWLQPGGGTDGWIAARADGEATCLGSVIARASGSPGWMRPPISSVRPAASQHPCSATGNWGWLLLLSAASPGSSMTRMPDRRRHTPAAAQGLSLLLRRHTGAGPWIGSRSARCRQAQDRS